VSKLARANRLKYRNLQKLAVGLAFWALSDAITISGTTFISPISLAQIDRIGYAIMKHDLNDELIAFYLKLLQGYMYEIRIKFVWPYGQSKGSKILATIRSHLFLIFVRRVTRLQSLLVSVILAPVCCYKATERERERERGPMLIGI